MRSARALTPAAYVLFAMLVLFPLSEVIVSAWPLRPGDTAWRYGAAGYLSRALMTPLLGIGLAAAVAVVNDHARFAKLLTITLFLGTVALVLVAVLFTLDLVQVRAQIQPELRESYLVTSVQALVKFFGAALATLLLALGLRKAKVRGPRHATDPTQGVVFGAGSTQSTSAS